VNTSLAYYASVLSDLHETFVPHAGQIIVGKSIFYDGCSFVFVQCGRKWGKTELCKYSLYRYAMTFPGSSCYYFAPFLKQAKEIVWANKSLQHFLPVDLRSKYGITENNSDLRISFANGSFIKVEGADNYEAVAGINPHFVVLDELKDIQDNFIEVMEPNLLAHSAPLLAVGSPPDNFDNLYCRLAEECRKGAPKKAWYKMPSSKNPHISRDFLEDKHQSLIARGEPEIWQREYLANIVVGGAKFIFPMMTETFVDTDENICAIIKASPKHFNYYVCFDPGTTSCFGVLMIAINKYNKKVYAVGEIYEKDQSKTTGKEIYKRAQEIWRNYNLSDSTWMKIYDYAASWFENEVVMEFDDAIMPCVKDLRNKEAKLSSIKQVMLEGNFIISDKCPMLYWELTNYRKDDKGRIPKENDHLIDCLRYIFNADNYFTEEGEIPVYKTDKRGFPLTPQDARGDDDLDPFEMITSEYYW